MIFLTHCFLNSLMSEAGEQHTGKGAGKSQQFSTIIVRNLIVAARLFIVFS